LLLWVSVFLLVVLAAHTVSRRRFETFQVEPSKHMGRELGTLNSREFTINVTKGTGSGAKHALDKDYRVGGTGVVVRFAVKFHPGFEWGCKGKVGGLAMGPGKSSGGKYSENGASLRIMWDEGGGAHAYIYTPLGTFKHQPVRELQSQERYGQTLFLDVFNERKKALADTKDFHIVDLGVKLNDVKKGYDKKAVESGKAEDIGGHTVYKNGRLLFAINGEERVLDGVIWRRYPNITIDTFGLGVFHGGPCKAEKNSKMSFGSIKKYAWKD
jgi:hypothetical protein